MKKYLFILFVFFQPGCLPAKKELPGLWIYSYNIDAGKPGDDNIAATSFIDFHDDGSYTRDFDKFDYGRWQRDDSALVLTGSGTKRLRCSIKRISDDELQLRIDNAQAIAFEKLPGKFEDASQNPFSLENNRWRIPATKKENEPELKTRLRNHCRFYEMYFKWALDNDLSSLDVRGTPSLIKIYGNGFELKPFDQLPEKWRSYFYDEDDCRQANEIVSGIFRNKEIVWGNTSNRYKMFLSAFQQMQQLLK